MIQLKRPYAFRQDKFRSTVVLLFDKKAEKEDLYSFYIRGGVSWPSSQSGYALVCCQEIKSKKIYVFEEFQFTSIENIRDDDGSIKHQGFGQWFHNFPLQHYGCTKFYHHENSLTSERWQRKLFDCKALKLKPIILPAVSEEKEQTATEILEQSQHVAWELLQQGKLFYSKNGQLYRDLQSVNVNSPELPASLRALIAALNGIENNPFYTWSQPEEYTPLQEEIGY